MVDLIKRLSGDKETELQKLGLQLGPQANAFAEKLIDIARIRSDVSGTETAIKVMKLYRDLPAEAKEELNVLPELKKLNM
ncbi:hypothetical protein AB6A40_009255 [Gnathostoma spinigerum]|uniref:Uncharacterized protein n=1 Tax=Gnathostoma spinigerum TaxID=75299 RepID=A0ABD6ETA3_9BILA